MLSSARSIEAEREDMTDFKAAEQKVVSPNDVAIKMKIDYSRGFKDHTTKNLEAFDSILVRLEQPNFDMDALTKDTAETLERLFSIESVGICIRGDDGLYRYSTVAGVDEQTFNEFKTIAYTEEQLQNGSVYPSHEISNRTRLYLTEDHAYAAGEELTFRRPSLIGLKRRTLTDALEADYIDFFFYDETGRISGYIESSGTRLKKLLDPETIRWMELMAEIMGVAFRLHRAGGASQKTSK